MPEPVPHMPVPPQEPEPFHRPPPHQPPPVVPGVGDGVGVGIMVDGGVGMGVAIMVDDGEGEGVPIMPLALAIGTSRAAASTTTARAVNEALNLSLIK